jgi:hypothetical protein
MQTSGSATQQLDQVYHFSHFLCDAQLPNVVPPRCIGTRAAMPDLAYTSNKGGCTTEPQLRTNTAHFAMSRPAFGGCT